MSENKKHRCKFEKFIQFVNKPLKDEDVEYWWSFKVERQCITCEKIKTCESNLSEVETYISSSHCIHCGEFVGETKHKDMVECFTILRNKINYLEEMMEKVLKVIRV
jgi:hypothetical protein